MIRGISHEHDGLAAPPRFQPKGAVRDNVLRLAPVFAVLVYHVVRDGEGSVKG